MQAIPCIRMGNVIFQKYITWWEICDVSGDNWLEMVFMYVYNVAIFLSAMTYMSHSFILDQLGKIVKHSRSNKFQDNNVFS